MRVGELTSAQIKASRAVAGTGTALCGAFLLMAACGVFPFGIKEAVAPALLFCAGAIFAITAFIQDNALNLWLAVVLLACGGVSLAATKISYGTLYPIYVAAPALASAVCAVYERNISAHFPIIVFFAAESVPYFLHTSGIIDIAVAVSISVIVAGVLLTIYSLIKKDKKEERK